MNLEKMLKTAALAGSVALVAPKANGDVFIGDHYTTFAGGPVAVVDLGSGLRAINGGLGAPSNRYLTDNLAFGPLPSPINFGASARDFSTAGMRTQEDFYQIGANGTIERMSDLSQWVVPGFDTNQAYGLAILAYDDERLAVATGLRSGVPSLVVYDMHAEQLLHSMPTGGLNISTIEAIGRIDNEWHFAAGSPSSPSVYQISLGSDAKTNPVYNLVDIQSVFGNNAGTGITGLDVIGSSIFITDTDIIGRGSYTPIPAPGTLALVGLAGLAASYRRRDKKQE